MRCCPCHLSVGAYCGCHSGVGVCSEFLLSVGLCCGCHLTVCLCCQCTLSVCACCERQLGLLACCGCHLGVGVCCWYHLSVDACCECHLSVSVWSECLLSVSACCEYPLSVLSIAAPLRSEFLSAPLHGFLLVLPKTLVCNCFLCSMLARVHPVLFVGKLHTTYAQAQAHHSAGFENQCTIFPRFGEVLEVFRTCCRRVFYNCFVFFGKQDSAMDMIYFGGMRLFEQKQVLAP